MTEPKANFVKYMSRFDEKEKAALCFLINTYGGNRSVIEAHKGLLPFLNIELIHQALRNAAALTAEQRYKNFAKRFLAKIPEAWEHKVENNPKVFLYMKLDPVKVHRHFGNHPERGKPLNHLPKVKVTVGKRWSLPKKSWVDDKDVLVTPCVTLKRSTLTGERTRGLWEVTVLAKCRYAVEMWLLEHCS